MVNYIIVPLFLLIITFINYEQMTYTKEVCIKSCLYMYY